MTETRLSQRKIHIRLAVIALVLILLGAALGTQASKFAYPEGGMMVYMTAAKRMVAGEEMLIRNDPLGAYTYPPAFALPFVPLLALPAKAQWAVFTCVNLLLLELVVYLVWRRVRPYMNREAHWWQRPAIWFAGVFVLAGRHLVSPIEGQCHDLLLFAVVLLGIDAWCASAGKRSGAWTGLGAALKATPLLFGPYYLWQRQWAAAAVMALSLAAVSLLPDVTYPRPDGQLHAVAWYRTFIADVGIGEPPPDEGWVKWNKLNQNLSGTLYRLTARVDKPTDNVFDVSIVALDPQTRKMVTAAAQLAIVAFMFWVTYPNWTRDLPADQVPLQRLGECGVVLCAMLLLSPMSGKAHFCALLVPIGFCVTDFLYRRPTVVVGVALAMLLMLTLTTKDIVGRPAGNALIAYGSVTWSTVMLMIASGCALIARSRGQLTSPVALR